ncbi:hypothetical protein JTE90_021596 [Oedothorax gibbosus]|uniref:PR domain zinc finger protein 13 n=1 Tax=Oedothorax gibbosus TaxID=931172 RepID=A0AAV6VRH5_9ARAC|nr:hypothetical protein JTE90_021596 [Oedothorax gibbosus]
MGSSVHHPYAIPILLRIRCNANFSAILFALAVLQTYALVSRVTSSFDLVVNSTNSIKSILKMNSSVIASCDIPEGACSMPGVGQIDMGRLLEKSSSKIYFHVDLCDGYLSISEKQVGKSWARFIAVARNCHEQNVELTKNQGGLVLRMIRPVKEAEELFVWVGADLLSVLEFPFLKPVNIKGNQAYHCHKCGRIFQNPNPLKVHLSFQCQANRFNEQHLKVNLKKEFKPWSLDRPFPNISDSSTMSELSVPLLLLPGSSTNCEIIPVGLHKNTTPTLQVTKSVQEPHSSGRLCPDMSFELHISQDSGIFPSPSSSMWFNHSSSCTIPNPGHVCGYCGKVYSRKYGLKIHVRTHTGYKPLKCKYCLRPFSDPSNLNKHVRLHSESDTPYRCNICAKVLVRRRDLQRHLRSRHPNVSFDENKKQNFLFETKDSLEDSK